MKLIINADDFGLSRGINFGIIDAHALGVLTSTTLMITMEASNHAIELSKGFPNLGIGLHLNITLGKPLTDTRTLVKENGEFYKPKEKPNQDLFDEEEIYQEFKAQYQAFYQKLKRKPTHFDSHLYAHQVYEKASRAVGRLALELDIPVRGMKINSYEAKFFEWFKFKSNNIDNLQKFLEYNFEQMLEWPVCELMVHPAYVDHFLATKSSYNDLRNYELEILISKEFKELIRQHNIKLITYDKLK